MKIFSLLFNLYLLKYPKGMLNGIFCRWRSTTCGLELVKNSLATGRGVIKKRPLRDLFLLLMLLLMLMLMLISGSPWRSCVGGCAELYPRGEPHPRTHQSYPERLNEEPPLQISGSSSQHFLCWPLDLCRVRLFFGMTTASHLHKMLRVADETYGLLESRWMQWCNKMPCFTPVRFFLTMKMLNLTWNLCFSLKTPNIAI